MIFGIGIDLAKISRFNKWIEDKNLLEKYFNEKEMILTDGKQLNERRISSLSQHYAARFAAKEAFSKALGTGISGFKLKDVYIQNEENKHELHLNKRQYFYKSLDNNIFLVYYYHLKKNRGNTIFQLCKNLNYLPQLKIHDYYRMS